MAEDDSLTILKSLESPRPFGPACRVPESVHTRAREDPAAPAVVDGNGVLSYGELDGWSVRLAAALRDRGVQPGAVVALATGGGRAMVAGALGILRAGAAYLPLDPGAPAARLGFMLSDARCAAVVAERCHAARVPGGGALLLDDLENGARARVRRVPAPARGDPDDVAYVIYTSGSSGEPKGVEITHASLANLVGWHRRAFAVTSADRATQIAAPGFDAAVWEIWPYLAAGASVHVPGDAVRRDPEALRDWLVRERISVTFAATPLAERLIGLRWPADTALRLLLTGGDTLHSRPPRGLPFRVVNNYGPTECTVVATSGPVAPAGDEPGPPPIGRPIDGARAYVLDSERRPVPAGEPGELYIGGGGVARGYVNRPALTAERFAADPWSAAPGARIYRTGDLVRARADGQLVFLGRVDDQLKIRGFRVEPAEIAARLCAHPDVAGAAVVGRATPTGAQRVVAYVVARAGARPARRALSQFVADALPDFMVPAVYVRVDVLPTTDNGKIDRSRLPEPAADNALVDDAPAPPRTAVEARVAAILAPLLGVPEVGVTDNFFALGGHSLLGTQLIARIRDAFGVELGLRHLFEAPTVAGLSAEIERRVLDEVAALTDEEVARSLARTRAGGECR